MTLTNSQPSYRLRICILAALSILIMFFTVVHLRHLAPPWQHEGADASENGELQGWENVVNENVVNENVVNENVVNENVVNEGVVDEGAVNESEVVDCRSLFYADEILNCINVRTKLKLKIDMGRRQNGARRLLMAVEGLVVDGSREGKAGL